MLWTTKCLIVFKVKKLFSLEILLTYIFYVNICKYGLLEHKMTFDIQINRKMNGKYGHLEHIMNFLYLDQWENKWYMWLT